MKVKAFKVNRAHYFLTDHRIYSRSGTYECILEQYHISFTYVSLLKDIQLKVFLLHAYLLVDPLDCITFSKIVRTLNFI